MATTSKDNPDLAYKPMRRNKEMSAASWKEDSFKRKRGTEPFRAGFEEDAEARRRRSKGEKKSRDDGNDSGEDEWDSFG